MKSFEEIHLITRVKDTPSLLSSARLLVFRKYKDLIFVVSVVVVAEDLHRKPFFGLGFLGRFVSLCTVD